MAGNPGQNDTPLPPLAAPLQRTNKLTTPPSLRAVPRCCSKIQAICTRSDAWSTGPGRRSNPRRSKGLGGYFIFYKNYTRPKKFPKNYLIPNSSRSYAKVEPKDSTEFPTFIAQPHPTDPTGGPIGPAADPRGGGKGSGIQPA